MQYFPVWVGVIFLMGIIAATYASTDSALAALTTSFCFDFLDFGKLQEKEKVRKKLLVHLGMSAAIWVVVLLFDRFNNAALITTVFELAGYTYGPLLGLFMFGLFTDLKIRDRYALHVCLAAPVLAFIFEFFCQKCFLLLKCNCFLLTKV